MCGIGGILRRDGGGIPESWVDILDARVAQRGPDDRGVFRDEVTLESGGTVRVALVHRRLSILDIEGGRQPMVSEAGENPGAIPGVAVVFNGCIYNHRELRAELEGLGHAFATDHSDTEVLIHGYREWGGELADHLEGMYAFAVWDHEKGTLLLARDMFGEKPLYMRWMKGERGREDDILAFSSDARALAMLPPVPPPDKPSTDKPGLSVPPSWTAKYLQLGTNWREETIYPGVVSVPSTMRADGTEARRHRGTKGSESVADSPEQQSKNNLRASSVPSVLSVVKKGDRATPAEIESLLRQAVHRRLEADVPLGVFLSGGIDSSLIAAFAKEKKPDLRTFTLKMPDSRYDESAAAEEVAAYLGTDHTTLEVSIDPVADLRQIIRILGQPFGDSSLLPTYWVSRAARQQVTVALSGDGGDELFIGYERYMAARALVRHRRLLKWLPRPGSRWFGVRGSHPKSKKHKLGRLGVMARDLKSCGILGMESIFSQEQIGELLGGTKAQRHGGTEGNFPGVAFHDPWDSGGLPGSIPGVGEPMQALRWVDLIQYLPNDLLLKVDTASMAVGLEVRAPFLDRDLCRAVLALPTRDLLPGYKRKGLLRQIARKHLPGSVVDRPKQGFSIPIGEWFREDYGGLRGLLEERLRGPHPFGPIELNQEAVERLLDDHLSGAEDHSQRLFSLLTLSLWAEMEEEIG